MVVEVLQKSTIWVENKAGYKRTLEKHKLDIDQDLIKIGDYRLDIAYRKTREVLAAADPPTALFVCNNQMTLGAVMAIRDAGLNIPDDISVIGFDDPEWARLMDPPLTVVAQPISQMGAKATEMLMARLNDGTQLQTSRVTLPLYFTERASCLDLSKGVQRQAQ
jgi:LacI family transcriptional regulator